MMLGRHPAPNWAARPELGRPPPPSSTTLTAPHQLAIAQLLPVVSQHLPLLLLLLLVHCLLHQHLVDLVTQVELVGGCGQLVVRCWCVGANPDSHPPTHERGEPRPAKGLLRS